METIAKQPEGDKPSNLQRQKKPKGEREPQGERKPAREKQPAAAPTVESAEGDTKISGDTWGKEEEYDPWAVPEKMAESVTPVAKPPREKTAPADRKPNKERKLLEKKSGADNAEISTSPVQDADSNGKNKSQAELSEK